MKNKQILDSVKKSIDQAPIDVLQNIKDTPRVKMLRHDEITEQKTRESSVKKLIPYASVAAAVVLMFFGWIYQTKMPDSHIYIDVNPSVEITTNRMNKVINIKANNQDGQILVENFNHKGMTIVQATEEVLDRMLQEKYIDKDHKFLLLSVYNKNKKKAESQQFDLDKKIHEHLNQNEVKLIVLSQKLDNTTTMENYSKEYGVSVSKMTFIKNLIILNPELQIEEIVELSIEDLVRLSQSIDFDLDKIIDSSDFDQIQTLEPKPVEPTTPEYDDDDDKDDGDDYADDDDDKDEDNEDDEKETTGSKISFETAKAIAIEKAGGGTITKFELDDDEYEVKIKNNGREYEIEIDAYTGEVIKYKVEDIDDDEKQTTGSKISFDTAKAIAIEKVGGGTITKFELDGDEYEMKIKNNGREYEIEIDAYTGEVIKYKVEDSDDDDD